jgi:hypothetical protein
MLKIISTLFILISFSACGGTAPTLPSGYTLPPMPDATANSATIAGIDSNNNGVRDDVEIYIYTNYSTPEEQKVLIQYAKVKQNLIIDSYDQNKTIYDMNQLMKYTTCYFTIKNNDAVKISTETKQIMAQILNTKERYLASLRSERLASGRAYFEYTGKDACE